MHRFHIVLLFLFTQAVFAQLPQLGKNTVNEVVKKMTLEEKAELLVGTGMQGYGSEDEVGANKVSDVATQINAGNDWLMPGTPQQITAVIQQTKKGKLKKSAMDESAERILKIIVKSPVFRNYAYTNKPDLKAHALAAKQAATESMVLFENNNQTLPIKLSEKKIALFGNASYNFISGGTGSGDVNEAYVVSLLEGLSNAGAKPDSKLENRYVQYVKKADSLQKLGKKEGHVSKYVKLKEMPIANAEIVAVSQQTDFAIFTIGRNAGESGDRPVSDFYLSEDEQQMIEIIGQVFHQKNKKFIIILNIGGVIETQSWKDKADAIFAVLATWTGSGNAVAEILSGNTNPSGKLAQTFPQKYEDVPSAKSFPGIPAENPLNSFYNEGIYVGYRFYDTFKIPVSYAFGYGLSYSEFSFSNLKIENNEGNQTLTLSFAITNSGKKSGKEVGQIYISAPKQKLKKPEQELKAFVKTEDLQPGKSQNFTVTIPYEDLASFSVRNICLDSENGTYEARIGNSSASILQKEYFEIEKELTISKVGNLMKPDAKINEIQ